MTFNNRELDILAARAAGLKVVGNKHPADGVNVICGALICVWRPRVDDGDALRPMAKLRIATVFEKLHTVSVWSNTKDDWLTEYCADGMGSDILQTTRPSKPLRERWRAA